VIDLMVNLARPYIIHDRADAGRRGGGTGRARRAALTEGDALVARLADLVARVDVPRRRGATGGAGVPSSPIIPVILGSEERAIKASAALLDQGLWVPAIRPPTVPVGTSRLRVTLSAAHTDLQVARLIQALAPMRAALLAQAL